MDFHRTAVLCKRSCSGAAAMNNGAAAFRASDGPQHRLDERNQLDFVGQSIEFRSGRGVDLRLLAFNQLIN